MKEHNMNAIATKRLKIIPLQSGSGISKRMQLAFIAELAALGYRLSNPAILSEMSEDSLVLSYAEIIKNLKAMRGGDVDYVPLFQGFPNVVPDQDEYIVRRILGFFGLDTFNHDAFGADPISQMQVADLYKKGVQNQKKRKSDTAVTWIDVRIEHPAETIASLKRWMLNCLYAKSSIKQDYQSDLCTLIDSFGNAIDSSKITIKENLVLVLKHFWNKEDYNSVIRIARTPTDLLRLFAALTDGDISLATPIKFPKLSRVQRRTICAVLDKSSNLLEDLNTYKSLWINIGQILHPGEFQNKFSRCADAFSTLRNLKVQTFNGLTEELISKKKVGELVAHLSSRPGLFVRKLHELLRKFPNSSAVITSEFAKSARSVPLKTLLVAKSYFATINTLDTRTIVNKKGKMKVLPNTTHGMLGKIAKDRVLDCLDTVIVDKLKTLDKLGKVWIDEELANFVVPLQERNASDALVSVGRGSKFSYDHDGVLRLFVYWKQKTQRTDLDLSVISFDDDLNYKGHVSWTNLRSGEITHSGDIQSAEFGAAEFIDIKLSAMPKNIRYLGIQVYKFAGEDFKDLDKCYAGWSFRDKSDNSVKTFDIQTVANKLSLSGTGNSCIPLVVDLVTKEIIFTDLYLANGNRYAMVESSSKTTSMMIREINKFTETRPNLYDLALVNAKARGSIVNNKKDADVTFGIKDCTFNVTDTEKILAELLVK